MSCGGDPCSGSVNLVLPLVVVIVLALSGAAVVHAEEPAATETTEAPNFKTMRIKELRAILEERGVECRGCAEKADYVERAAEVYHLPVKAKEESSAESDKPPVDGEEVERMMRQMKDGPEPTGDKERQGTTPRGTSPGSTPAHLHSEHLAKTV